MFSCKGNLLARHLVFPLSIVTLGLLLALHSYAVNLNSSVIVGNGVPTASSIFVNSNNSITLTGNDTQSVSVSYILSDPNGCTDINNATITLYRSSISYPCVSDYENCYITSTSTEYSCTGTSTLAYATSTLSLYYFADATDASSSYPSQNWLARVDVRDKANSTGTATSTGVEVNSLTAINPTTSTIDYGLLNAGQDSSSTNQTVEIANVGNTSTTLNINSSQTLQSGANKITTSSQHYASSSFTYGGTEQLLQTAVTALQGLVIKASPKITGWRNVTALPYTNYLHSAAVYNGYIYVTGGAANGLPTSTVKYAQINATGSLSSWASAISLQYTAVFHSAVTHNGYLYVVGGTTNGSYTSTVTYAQINATGSLGAWQTATPLPYTDSGHSTVVHNGYLYVTGGIANGSNTSTVKYAQINATGSLGVWQTAPSLPYVIDGHSSVSYNGYIYVTGGLANGSYTSTVKYAKINATGSLGVWATATPMPYTNVDHSVNANNGHLYVTGGCISGMCMGSNTSTVKYAQINATGSLGAWQTATALPYSNRSHSAVAWNGYFYVVGGEANDYQTSTVIVAPLPSRNTYWGLGVPAGTPTGTYTGVNTFTGVFSP